MHFFLFWLLPSALTKKTKDCKEESEDPGPEAAAAVVTAGVALSARSTLLCLLLVLLQRQHCRVETFSALTKTPLGLKVRHDLDIQDIF